MTTTTTPTTTTTTTPNHLRLLPPSPPKIRLNIIRLPPSHPHQEARGPHYHNNNFADPSASALSPPILSLFTAPISMAIRPNADNVAAIAFVGNPLVVPEHDTDPNRKCGKWRVAAETKGTTSAMMAQQH